ncbi:uncharacterized protein HKW66_Vig0097690 [Vigna angularis]|uniref:Uncharacterized protein n=1 Tax=Phaseolus angularis TaxID=3914 RepID=A0A8T0KK84_PHAAN|nr:uncharacterized protein HKW66_Vig0097690 [Vigna angularis]
MHAEGICKAILFLGAMPCISANMNPLAATVSQMMFFCLNLAATRKPPFGYVEDVFSECSIDHLTTIEGCLVRRLVLCWKMNLQYQVAVAISGPV